LAASNDETFRLTNRTSGLANTERLAVVKSEKRVPIPMTTSACAASVFAAAVPVAPIAPTDEAWSHGSDPLPAWVSPTGMPVASTNAASAPVASA